MVRSNRPERRAARATARAETAAVRTYLEALQAAKRRPGRLEAVRSELALVHEQMRSVAPVEELLLLQQRRELMTELRSMADSAAIEAAEAAFVAVAASYSESHGIDYATWLEVGVDAAVLDAAGIPRPAS